MKLTTEEAIKFLGRYVGNEYYTPKCQEAHRMAIAALRKQVKPNTFADQIRAMNDQEICDAIFQIIYAADPANWFCKGKKECGELMDADKEIPDEMCKKCLLEQLQKPVEEPSLPVRFHMDKQESGLLEEN